ncbi:MAG: 16S rRNA pseudouridine(516) synthase, partial [Ruminococcus sp.]
NGALVTKPDQKIDEENDEVTVKGEKIEYSQYVYLVMNKPSGYVSATSDRDEPTVIDLVPKELRRKGIFPAGRLDKDTTGLLIITDDGEFAHRMLSPKKHINKKYVAVLDGEVTQDMVQSFKEGVTFKDGTKCLPATLIPDKNDPTKAQVIIGEGKFHQVKKMFLTQGLRVKTLKRVAIGGFVLPENLPLGGCRTMLEREKQLIFL